MRSVWLDNEARQRVRAPTMWPTSGNAICRPAAAQGSFDRPAGHGRSGNNRDYVLATVKAIEAEGFRTRPASAGDDVDAHPQHTPAPAEADDKR